MNRFSLRLILLCLSLTFVTNPLVEAQITSQSYATETTFISPTERFMLDNPIEKINQATKNWGIDAEYRQLFEHLIAQETEGFFGYNGGTREFRIFQDIIRFGLEEILNIPVKPDFYFLRVPGDPDQNLNSAAEFLKTHQAKIHDNIPIQGQQVLSINGVLYANYHVGGESTIWFFMTNFSANDYRANNHAIYKTFENKLVAFFTKLGIDPSYIHPAFEIALSKISKKGGYLLQLFNHSDYEFTDAQTFLANPGGTLHSPNQPISRFILDPTNRKFQQFRLILNNKHTLNPYSSLSMKRYDMTSPEATQDYEQAMRNYFQTLPVDVYQKELYKNELLTLWGM